jgi:hypothetical protein
MFILSNKKAISPVIGIALLLVVVVIGSSGISIWYSSFSSDLFVEVNDEKKFTEVLTIENIIGENLYLSTTKSVYVDSISVGNLNCNFNGSISGLNPVNISSCIENVNGPINVIIVTNEGVFSTSKYILDVDEFISVILDIVGYNSTLGQWIGGSAQDYIRGIAVDSNGSIYVGGDSSSASFDDGLGTMSGSKASSDYEAFIIKFNSSGSFEWGQWVGHASGASFISDLTVDSQNNVYVTGDSFYSPFNDGLGSMSGTHSGDYEGFIIKFNSSGSFEWGQWVGGTSTDSVKTITIDSQDNVLVGGWVSFSSSTGDGFTPSGTRSGNKESYIIKFNSSGSYLWGHWIGGISADEITSIALDSQNNAYVAGNVLQTTELSEFTLNGNPSYAPFQREGIILKFNSSGSFDWGQWVGGSGSDKITDITVDNNDHLIVVGTASANITDDNLTFLSGSNYISGTEVFLLKFNSSGSNIWSTWIPSAFNPYDVFLDTNSRGDIYVEYEGSTNAAFLKFNSSGQYQSNISLGRNYDSGIGVIFFDENDNLYFAGKAVDSGFNNELITPEGTYTSSNEGYFFKFEPILE